jgi:hypothetical protein
MPASACAAVVVAIALAGALQAAGEPPLAPPWVGTLRAAEAHPCLFFGADDLNRLRERVQREPYSLWLDRSRGSSVPLGPALVWALTGDEKQAAIARGELVDKTIWREPVHNYIEPSSHSFYLAAAAYDLLFAWEGLSAEDHRVIRDKLAAEAEFYLKTMDSVPGGCNYGNQRVLGASALGMCAMVLADYTGSAHTPQQWLDRALHETRRPENYWFFRPDGSFVEGYGYTTYMGCLLVPFIVAYYRNTGQDLLDDPALRAMLHWHAYFLLPDGQNPNFGTTNHISSGASLYLPFVNREFGGEMLGLYAWAARRSSNWGIHPHLHSVAIAWFDDTIAPAPEQSPPSAVFPVSEMMVMKDGWQDDLTGVWVTGKDSGWLPERYRTYSHADPTSFMFYSDRSWLVGDSGYPHWRNYSDGYGPQYHNLVLVDGQGPAQDTLADLRDAAMTPQADACTVETEYAGVTVQRLLLFAERRMLLVMDFLRGEGPHEYLYQLHTALPPDAEGVRLGARQLRWPGWDMGRTQTSDVVGWAHFAGPVQLERVPSQWLPTVAKLEPNVAFGARWFIEGPNCLLSALHAQRPGQPAVTVATRQEGVVQHLEARTDEWVLTAQARPEAGPLTDGGARVTAQALVVCRDVTGGARWVYVWGAREISLPGLQPAAIAGLSRALIVRQGDGWTVATKAEGT